MSKLSRFLVSIFKAVKLIWVLMFLCSKILHSAEVWYVWCVCICSLMQLSWYIHEIKVMCSWKCIQMIFLFQQSVVDFRQANEPELLPEHIPLWVFKHPGSGIDNIYHCVPHSMSTLAIFIKDVSETIIISAPTLGWNPNAERTFKIMKS